jgi:hypothetical protein
LELVYESSNDFFRFCGNSPLVSEATVAGAPEWPTCSTSGLTQGIIGSKTVDGQRYYVRRLANIFASALEDFGATAVDDNLEIFCVSRTVGDRLWKIAMCLSGETCPWR